MGGRIAGKSTLNRMEHAGKIGRDRHYKLDHDPAAIDQLFFDLFIEAHSGPPSRIVLDLVAHEGGYFHGYYECYCYLRHYVSCGRPPLAAKLRWSSVDAADGAEVARIVARIRRRWRQRAL